MTSLANRRRVRFETRRTQREDRLAVSSFANESSSDEEGDPEAQEQERYLSAQNGEAAEAPSSGRKRQQTDQEIEAEYSSQRRKKPRPCLLPSHLTGSTGLVCLPHRLRTIRYPQETKTKTSVNAAARYSRAIVHAYKSFCFDMFPGMAFEDVLSRIESFGSKREVKGYLNHMRDGVRNMHLEKIYGKEKASKMIQELEYGLRQQEQNIVENVESPVVARDSSHENEQPPNADDSKPKPPSRENNDDSVDSAKPQENEPSVSVSAQNDAVAKKTQTVTAPEDADSDSDIDWDPAATASTKKQASVPPAGSALVDTSDEEDGTQEDVGGEDEMPSDKAQEKTLTD